MTIFQWLIFFFIIQLIHGLGTWKLYKSAGYKPLVSFIPFYNALVLMKIINRPWWWVILLLIPVVNLLILPVIWVETSKTFGKNSTTELVLSIITLGFFLFSINYSKKIKIPSTKNKVATKEQPLFVVNTTENNEKSSEIKFEKIDNTVAYSSSIKVNADDLLFSVTHNQKEVAAYYASNNIDREKLLKSIENELKKSDIKIDASSILAEVEGNINEDTFKNNFLQMIKKKVSDVASAVATRNN